MDILEQLREIRAILETRLGAKDDEIRILKDRNELLNAMVRKMTDESFDTTLKNLLSSRPVTDDHLPPCDRPTEIYKTLPRENEDF